LPPTQAHPHSEKQKSIAKIVEYHSSCSGRMRKKMRDFTHKTTSASFFAHAKEQVTDVSFAEIAT